MQLIGLLDSPYVRRVAISLQLLGLSFEHRPVSVFRHLDAFRAINPVVKAPTLVADDGSVLMDSTLIIDHAESLAPARSLMPRDPAARVVALRRLGLALAACEKSVQIVYERTLRPPERRHAPWMERVAAQLQAACLGLEQDIAADEPAVDSSTIGQDAVTAAIVWHFLRAAVPDAIEPAAFPALTRLSARAEALPEFANAPHGEGVCAAATNAA